MQFLKNLSNHRYAVALAALIAALAVLPYLIAPIELGSAYRGIPFFFQDSEDTYLARIQEIADGNYFIASPFYFEYKSPEISVMMPYGEWLYAPLILLGVSPAAVALGYKFLIPFLIFLLAYVLVVRIRNDDTATTRAAGLLAATLVTQGIEYIHPSFVYHAIAQPFTYPLLSIWTRLVNPGTGMVLLLVFLNLLLTLVRKPTVRMAAVSGVVVGVQIGYIFTFLYSGVVLGVVTAASLLARKVRVAYVAVSVGIIALVFNAQYLWEHIGATDPEAVASGVKNGLIVTRLYMLNKWALAVSMLLALSLFIPYSLKELRTRLREEWFVASAVMLVASLVAFNIQLVLGKTVWPQHFVQFTIPVGWIVISLIACAIAIRIKLEKVFEWAVYVFIFLSLVFTSWTIGSIFTVFPTFEVQQRAAPIFEWLRANAGDSCVVLSIERPQFVNRLLPAHTQCDPYMSSYIYMTPHDRILHGFYLDMKLRGVTPENADEYMTVHADDVREYFSENWGEIFNHQADTWLKTVYPLEESRARLESKRLEILAGYEAFFKHDLYAQVREYRVDYITVDTSKYQLPTELKDRVKRLQVFDGIELYELK